MCQDPNETTKLKEQSILSKICSGLASDETLYHYLII